MFSRASKPMNIHGSIIIQGQRRRDTQPRRRHGVLGWRRWFRPTAVQSDRSMSASQSAHFEQGWVYAVLTSTHGAEEPATRRGGGRARGREAPEARAAGPRPRAVLLLLGTAEAWGRIKRMWRPFTARAFFAEKGPPSAPFFHKRKKGPPFSPHHSSYWSTLQQQDDYSKRLERGARPH